MDSEKDKIIRLKQGQRIAFLAAFATLFIALTKAFVGYFFDAKVLVADAFHSGADLLAIFASGFGLWLAAKKKTKRFPYGLYKAETLITFIIGALIVWAAGEIFKDGYRKFFHIASVGAFPFLPVGVSVMSIIAAYFIAKKEKAAGEALGSQSLLANANESFLDILISAVVLAGILLAYARIPYVEGAIIILISLLIVKLGLENVWNSLLILMDANLDSELQSEIEGNVNEIYGVKGGCAVKLRRSGPFKMVECTIKTSPTLLVYKAHELADKAEDFITKNYKDVESVFIQIEPSQKKSLSAIIPIKDMNGLDSKVHGHFGRAPYYVIVTLNDESEEIEDFYYNEFLAEKKHIGVKVIKTVIRYRIDLLFTPKIGEISFHILKDNFVDIYRAEENMTVRDIVERYRNGRVSLLTAPTHPVEESQTGGKQ